MKQGDGVSAYVSYKVVSTILNNASNATTTSTSTNTNLPTPGTTQYEVIRRFRDFTWLKKRLRSQYRGVIVPALPEKSVVEKYKMSPEFIEQRRAALTVFLNRIAAHPTLSYSPDFRLFLQADETEFAIEASRMAAEAGDAAPAATGGAAGAARKTISSAARLLRSISQTVAGNGASHGPSSIPSTSGVSVSTSGIASARDEEESAQYLKHRAYFYELEALLTEAHRQAERLVRHHGTLAAALSEFSGAMAALGRHQEEEVGHAGAGPVAQSFSTLSEQASKVANVSRTSAEQLHTSLEAPMKEFMRSVRSAKKAMEDRSEALGARQAARAEVDAKRARLTRLRTTPGLAEERVVEAERELTGAMGRADATAAAYAELVQRMDVDLVRFQQERVEEMSRVLNAFAEKEAEMANETAALWQKLSLAEA